MKVADSSSGTDVLIALIFRASETIKSGDEVYNCYGPHQGHMEAKNRKEILKRQYLFDCNCIACSEYVI